MTSLLSAVMPEWFHPTGKKKKMHELVAKGTSGQYAVYQKKDGTKFFVVVNDHGTTVQYSILKDGDFSCTFAGATFTKLKDAVVAIVRKSQKVPFKSSVEGKEGLKLTTAAVKKKKASATQLALFDDDGGLEIPKEEHLHVNPETKELYRSTDAPAPAPIDDDGDDEVFEEPNHDDPSARPPSPPVTSFDALTSSGSSGGNDGGGGAASPPETSFGAPSTTSASASTSTSTSTSAGLFHGLESDDDDMVEPTPTPTTMPAPAPAAVPVVSAVLAVASAGKGEEEEEEEREEEELAAEDSVDTELDALMAAGIDEDLDALMNRGSEGKKKSSSDGTGKNPAGGHSSSSGGGGGGGLFDVDDDEVGDGSNGNVDADGMGADDIDAYLRANT